jgi:hypothetical protein
VIEENGGRRHAAPIANELGKGQEEEEEDSRLTFFDQIGKFWRKTRLGVPETGERV